MIAIITQEQKDLLIGQRFDGIQFFNPVQDIDNNWCISQEEINQCTNVDFQWVKDLTLSTFTAPVYPELLH
jgi:hypothetical protein